MTTKPVYAIAVFNDSIKGTVKLSEDLTNNRIKIDLNITGLNPNSFPDFLLCRLILDCLIYSVCYRNETIMNQWDGAN